MKTLIAVMGAEAHIVNGMHQLSRDTWVRDAHLLGDFRFFIGNGDTPLQEDEIRVDVPDGKEYVLYKTVELLRWGLERGYERFLKLDTDTHVNVREMVKQDLSYDYAGAYVGRVGDFYGETLAHSFIQGSAMWLSACAARIVVAHVVSHMNIIMPQLRRFAGKISPYPHSEDLWIGQVLAPSVNGGMLRVSNDRRYGDGPLTFHFALCRGTMSEKEWLGRLADWHHKLYAARGDNSKMMEVHNARGA